MVLLRNVIVKSLITVIAAVVISYSIDFISRKINFLDRFSMAITDIDFTDLYYQDRTAPLPDTNIVIVNIGFLNRREVAQMLEIISAQHPKVVGFDIFFGAEADSLFPVETQELARAFGNIDYDVLASAYRGKTTDGRDSIEGQSPIIRHKVTEGIVNLNIATDDPEMGTVRSFNPMTRFNGERKPAFGFEVAKRWNPEITPLNTLDDQFIRWYGYARRIDAPDSLIVFPSIEGTEILSNDFHAAEIKDKIVLVGFAGESLDKPYYGDKFYSPLNHKTIGRSMPDMFGVEVHANIIKMIIDDSFIFHSGIADFIVNFFFVLLLALIMIPLYRRYPKQYPIASKVLLIIYIDIIAFLAISTFIFTEGQIKFLIGSGLFVMLFVPDTYEFLEHNFFRKVKGMLIKKNEEEVVEVEN